MMRMWLREIGLALTSLLLIGDTYSTMASLLVVLFFLKSTADSLIHLLLSPVPQVGSLSPPEVEG